MHRTNDIGIEDSPASSQQRTVMDAQSFANLVSEFEPRFAGC